MKRSLVNIAMALCIGLFAACSQEEIITSASGEVETVSIDAQLPQTVGTRAFPEAAKDHQLRCILEVWEKAGTLITRIEKLATAATDGKLQFTFSVGKDVNYQCLLWADFIASDASTSSAEGGNTLYTDKYFTTTNLKAIDFKATDATLFNNPSSDAFCGAVDKNGTTAQLSVTLKRPFTKVTLTDNSEYINDCTELGVAYNTPSGYNIATGIATTMTAVNATGLEVNGKTWFSTYIFASTDKKTLDQDITMTVTKAGGTETRKIKGGQISLDANKESNANANFSDDEDVDLEVNIDGGVEDPNALKIGQFVNKDGTVVDAYDAANTIAIIFASGAKANDAVANYDSKFADKKIAGYAMTINSVARAAIYAKNDVPDTSPEITNATPWNEDYKGIVYSAELLTKLTKESTAMFKAEGAYPNWLTANSNTGTNLSEWYIPTASQALDCFGMFFGYIGTGAEESIRRVAQNTAFRTAYDTTGKVINLERPKGANNFLTSDVTAKNYCACIQLTVPDPPAGNAGVTITKVSSMSLVNTVMICPVLTIFK